MTNLKLLKTARAVVFASIDPEHGPWLPIRPEYVTPEIIDPDTLGMLLADYSLCAQAKGGGLFWYRAQEICRPHGAADRGARGHVDPRGRSGK